MPVFRQGLDAQGRVRMVRPPFKPEAYAAPPDWVPGLRANYASDNPGRLLAEPGGPFGAFARVRTITRDGKQFAVLLRSGAPEWGLEVELTDGGLGEFRELTPDEAWALATEGDSSHDPPIEVGPVDLKLT